MKNKVVSAQEAIRLIRDRDTLVCSGFGVVGVPDELLLALQERFTSTASPRDLTLVFGGGPGDGKDQGLNRLAHDGLIQRAIGGHWALVPKLGQMALANQFEAYNLPLGVISHLYRDIAGVEPPRAFRLETAATVPITAAVRNKIRQLNIRFAKGKKAA